MQTYQMKIALEHLLKNILPSNIQKKDASLSAQSLNVCIDFSVFTTKMNSEGKGTNLCRLEINIVLRLVIQSTK